MSEFEDSAFCLINRRRAEHGLQRLRPDGLLRKAAAAIVTAWMNSAEHRIYLLKPRIEELGVAAVRGYPPDPADPSTVTVTSEFGFRRD